MSLPVPRKIAVMCLAGLKIVWVRLESNYTAETEVRNTNEVWYATVSLSIDKIAEKLHNRYQEKRIV